MPSKPETIRGHAWARRMKHLGCWVEKLHGSGLTGLPDYLVGRPHEGVRFVEAKTLAAVGGAREGIPAMACSRAQRFFLDQVVKCGGRAGLLVLGPYRYVELDWRDMAQAPFDSAALGLMWRY